MSNFVYSKQPPAFIFGQNVDIFLDRIESHVRVAKIETKLHLDTLITFLDNKSIRRVKQLVFSDFHKTDGSVDLFKSREILKTAFSFSTDIQPEILLRYRKQLESESIADFSYEMLKLGKLAFGPQFEASIQLIEAFCSGLLDSQLSARLWRKISTFKTFKEISDKACEKEAISTLEEFIDSQKKSPLDKPSVVANTDELTATTCSENIKTFPRSVELRKCFYCKVKGHLIASCLIRKEHRALGRLKYNSRRGSDRSLKQDFRLRQAMYQIIGVLNRIILLQQLVNEIIRQLIFQWKLTTSSFIVWSILVAQLALSVVQSSKIMRF